MNNSLKIFINYYDILSKIFFLGLAFFAILFYILNTSQIFAEEETDTTIFIAYDTDNLNDEAKGNLASLQFVQSELSKLNGQLAVYKTAERSYSKALQDELND